MSDVRHQIVELLPRLMRFAYSLTGSRDDAQDLVQTACERALSRLGQYEPGTRLDSWMFRIVQTTWIDQRRAMKVRQTAALLPEAEMDPSQGSLHEQTESRQLLEIVQRHILELPEAQRVVLALVTIDGMSYQDVADLLGVPIGTVMSRLFRARQSLAQTIDPQFEQPHGRVA